MIYGYEGKPFYDAFLEAYKENKFVDSNTENKNEESNEVEI